MNEPKLYPPQTGDRALKSFAKQTFEAQMTSIDKLSELCLNKGMSREFRQLQASKKRCTAHYNRILRGE